MTSNRVVCGLILALLCGAPSAWATTIIISLPEFNGTFHDASETFPLAPIPVGTFTYDLPAGETIRSAMLTGRFGNSQDGGTAPLDVLLSDLLIAQCTTGGSCTQVPDEEFSFNFSKIQFQYLVQQSVPLNAGQTGPGTIRLGQTTLTIETAPVVPEPASGVLIGTSLLGTLLIKWRRSSITGQLEGFRCDMHG